MPSLVFEQSGSRHGGTIRGRVLIGRRLSHGIVIGDPAVSRLHAWIDNPQGDYVLTDAGSRTGTFVNGEAIIRRYLEDGDEIRVGPLTLVWREDDAVPTDALALDLSSPGKIESSKAGILFDCTCGAPLWVGLEYAGKRGLCKYCGDPIRVPTPKKPKPANGKRLRPAAPPQLRAKCGVCHSGIDPSEQTTTCPDCHTTFHTDCWQENYGCSSYGCAQVNAMKPASVVEAEAKIQAAAPAEPPVRTPWELLLLAGSAVASLVGALLFGLPAAIVATASLVLLIRRKDARRGLLVAALLLSLIGVVIGLALSDFWWLGGYYLARLRG
jgi:hypothetical protein